MRVAGTGGAVAGGMAPAGLPVPGSLARHIAGLVSSGPGDAGPQGDRCAAEHGQMSEHRPSRLHVAMRSGSFPSRVSHIEFSPKASGEEAESPQLLEHPRLE